MGKINRTFSRRDFLSRGVSGIAGVGILGIGKSLHEPDVKRNSTPTKKGKTIQRILGKTGIRIPIVNMGVMNSMDPAMVKRAYEIGVRHFDTAAWYFRGQNEIMVGNVIKEMKIRDQVVIGTKIFIPHQQRGMSHEEAKEAYLKIADESLKRLQIDTVDILYSHNVGTPEWLNNPGIVEALQLLKKEKKVRFIGFTTHSNMAEVIEDAARSGIYDVIETAFNYSMYDNRALITAMKNAAGKGIGLVAMKTQCQQAWYKPPENHEKRTYYEGKINHKALLKWVLNHPFITTAIPGCTTFQQLEEDFLVASDLTLSSEEKKFLKDRNVQLALSLQCQQCGTCISTCPERADIPTLLRIHMYAVCYVNFSLARQTLEEVPRNKGPHACSGCRTCTARCKKSVDLSNRIAELKTIFT